MSLYEDNTTTSQDIYENSNCQVCRVNLKLHDSLLSDVEKESYFLQMVDENKDSADKVDVMAEVAKSTSSFQTPMCEECHEELIQNMEKQVTLEKEQNACYTKYLKSMIETRAQVEQDEENGRRLLAELKEKESSLCKQLLELNEEEKSLLNQTEELEKLEQKVKDDYSQNYCSLRDIHSDMTSLTLKEANFNGIISSSRDHLEVLTKTNVLNKTFYINVDEKDIGSINGLRLVRLSNENTTIAESNAAWGQCVLCLHVLFNLNQIKATPYELIPVGAFSTIVYTDDAGVKDVKNLHQNSFAIYRSSSYDTAIGYFLNCLRKFDTEFRTKVKVPNNTIFPNTIYKDKIAEGFVPDVNNQSVIWYSGKISLNKHERWTKAMRLMLLNLKAAILATAIAKGI